MFLFIHADSDYVGPLKTTYQPQDQNALPGDSTRFFCEAFIGAYKQTPTFFYSTIKCGIMQRLSPRTKLFLFLLWICWATPIIAGVSCCASQWVFAAPHCWRRESLSIISFRESQSIKLFTVLLRCVGWSIGSSSLLRKMIHTIYCASSWLK